MTDGIMEAYTKATYFVLRKNNFLIEPHNLHFQIQCGQKSTPLDLLLNSVQSPIKSWALITAWNPNSVPLDVQENQSRNKKLLESIQHFTIHFAFGISPDFDKHKALSLQKTDWPPEESFLILGISRKTALSLGKIWEQNAILFGEQNGVVEQAGVFVFQNCWK
mgnify:CR=1 FL=1